MAGRLPVPGRSVLIGRRRGWRPFGIVFLALALANPFVVLLSDFGLLGDLVIIGVGAVALVFGRLRFVDKELFLVALAFLLCVGVYSLSSLLHPEINSVKHTVGFILSFFIFRFCFERSGQIVQTPGVPISLIGLIGFYAIFQFFDLGIGKNAANGAMAYHIFLLGVVLFARSPNHSRLIAACMFFCVFLASFASGHRTLAALGMICSLLALLPPPLPRRVWHALLPWILGAVIVGFILTMTDRGPLSLAELDRAVIEWTGRPAKSGRHVIWQIILSFAEQRPFFGWGAGALFTNIHDSEWSSHSYYLQVLLQTGYLGLGSVILLFLSIWHIARPSVAGERPGFDHVVGLVVVFVIVHSSTEVFLTQNLLFVGMPAWMALGVALGEKVRLSRMANA